MDKRKFNGGNSTKSKGVDKRKNDYKNALEDASTIEDVVSVLKSVKKQALEGDLQASKLFLAYYLGNPKSTTDITTNGKDINISPIEWVE
jgi:hypothetical protein